jgi:hypothetical protein
MENIGKYIENFHGSFAESYGQCLVFTSHNLPSSLCPTKSNIFILSLGLHLYDRLSVVARQQQHYSRVKILVCEKSVKI